MSKKVPPTVAVGGFMEPRELIAIMAATIFAARPDGKDAHTEAVANALKLHQLAMQSKNSNFRRFDMEQQG